MPSLARSAAALIAVLAALSGFLTFTEARLRLPYTTPVIQTTHSAVTHPETGHEVAVLPVDFAVTVADCFSKPIALVNGTRVRGAVIIQTHIFKEASMKLVFDVPNPGLDFVMNLTSDEFPVIQDQYGSLWKPVSPLKLEMVKQDTKYTYDVGGVGMTSYQSQSESVITPVGTPQYDLECYRTQACCGLNVTHFRKYALIDSPVPPYACTRSPVTYQPSVYSFTLRGRVYQGTAAAQVLCRLKASDGAETSFDCTGGAALHLDSIVTSPSYSIPSTGYALCRQGTTLIDPTYEALPIPVVYTAFCSTKTCIGYTSKNYMDDRVKCLEHSLGFFTSLDGNNSNQFSFYANKASAQWKVTFTGLRWIDDIGMSSPTTIQNISFQRDVPASAGWSLTYADFPLPLTDALQPLFPIGRPTRVTARLNDDASPTAVVVSVEYVSFSNFTATNWTIRTCVGVLCSSSRYPAAPDMNRYPTLMSVTVPLSSLGLTPQLLLPTEVNVTVVCETTPTANPFRTLLQLSTVTVQAAIRPPATQTVNASLAREPLQKVPSPYAASLGANATSRIICQGDYRFSAKTGTCVPLTDRQCAIKYRGRSILFNATMNKCMCRAPRLTSPLVYRPLPDPLPPPKFTEENIRALMKKIKLAKFMQTMESAIAEHDTKLASQAKSGAQESLTLLAAASRPQAPSSVSAAAAANATAAGEAAPSLPAEYPLLYKLCIASFVVTGGSWVFILFRDVFYKWGGVGRWAKKDKEAEQQPVAAPPLTPTSVPPAAQTPPTHPLTASPLPQPAQPTPTPSTQRAGQQPKPSKPVKDKRARGKGVAAKESDQQQQQSAQAAGAHVNSNKTASDVHPQPFTASSHQAKHHHAGKRSRGESRRHSSHDRQPPHASRQTAPTWSDVPPAACEPPPLHFDAHGFAAEQHTPFGYTSRGYAPDADTSLRGEFTSRSGRGGVGEYGSGRDFAYYDAYEFMPASPTFAESPEDPRWFSFAATPPRSPPTEGAAWGSRGFGEGYFADLPPYARVPSMHDPFGSSHSAAAHSMPSGRPSFFDSEQHLPREIVRQSSRVEELSSDADEHKTSHHTPAETRSHHVESID
ncbi:hypothetical protein NQL31_006274 [Lotmaria passim]